MKRNSVVEMNEKSYNMFSDDTQKLSGLEGLDGHKLSVRIRQRNKFYYKLISFMPKGSIEFQGVV